MNNEPLVIRDPRIRMDSHATEFARAKQYSDEKFAAAQRAEQQLLDNSSDGQITQFLMQVYDMIAGLFRRGNRGR